MGNIDPRNLLPSWELAYPSKKAWKMIFRTSPGGIMFLYQRVLGGFIFFGGKLSPLSGEVTQFHYSTIFQRVLTTNKFSHGTCTSSNSEGQSIIQNVHCLGSGVNFWWCKIQIPCIAILIWFLGSWSMSPNSLSWQLIIVYFVFVIIPSPRYM